MDLSGIIFAALAVGWAVYLIPKALQHNEELARTRTVRSFSGRMRVLGSGQQPAPVEVAAPQVLPAPVRRVTREAARKAAQRRRRVLLVLVFALGTVGALTGFAIAPMWAPAIPGGLIVLFLVIARMSVRKQTQVVAAPVPVVASFADEDTQGIDVSELRMSTPAGRPPVPESESAPAASALLPDAGSLWDPLPVTLPTYVTKPTARRTVRTISLTQTTSSGHDAADSKLAREAEAVRKAQEAKAAPAVSEEEQRKVVGG